ncbi:MAG: chemotaxis response regulator protein-glutamate methylesterase [Pirellulaceae bacterium]
MSGKKIKVLVVDDSALMRQLIVSILNADPAIEVVGTASDPFAAKDKILTLEPDVLTLDVEMPKMDGLTFLEKLMAGRPMPVVMLSSLTEKGCETTLRALELGAVDFITKPKLDLSNGMVELGDVIIEKVKSAASARIRRRPILRPVVNKEAIAPPTRESLISSTHKVIAIGASTGGTEAVAEVLSRFPPDAPGTIVVIHMPEGFTRTYAERLDRTCQIRVKEAEDGDRILPGHTLIAPGSFHMEAIRSGATYAVRVFDAAPVSRHKPSVDVMFRSGAKYLGRNGVGVLLTGMGKDGAEGLLAMKEAGAHTICQDEATCVVFGMPREAIALGAAADVLPLERIAAKALSAAKCEVLT